MGLVVTNQRVVVTRHGRFTGRVQRVLIEADRAGVTLRTVHGTFGATQIELGFVGCGERPACWLLIPAVFSPGLIVEARAAAEAARAA